MNLASTRRLLYLAARAVGDAQAARKGPGSFGRRMVRRRAHRATGAATGRFLRRLGI